MVAPSAGQVVLIPFPFSDLSQSKVRPALCLADAGRSDWILCQITSNPFGDPNAISISAADFADGGLKVHSFARPGRLFTASSILMRSIAGTLHQASLTRVIDGVIELLRPVP